MNYVSSRIRHKVFDHPSIRPSVRDLRFRVLIIVRFSVFFRSAYSKYKLIMLACALPTSPPRSLIIIIFAATHNRTYPHTRSSPVLFSPHLSYFWLFFLAGLSLNEVKPRTIRIDVSFTPCQSQSTIYFAQWAITNHKSRENRKPQQFSPCVHSIDHLSSLYKVISYPCPRSPVHVDRHSLIHWRPAAYRRL